MVYMIESQIEHVRRAIEHLDQAGAATLEVSRQAHVAFYQEVDARLRGTVWDTGGGASFYVDRTGRNATLWPDWTWRFRRRCARFEPNAYTLAARHRALVTA